MGDAICARMVQFRQTKQNEKDGQGNCRPGNCLGQEVTQEDVRRMAEAVGNETDSTCPPSDEYLPVDEGDDYGPEELSYTDLIEDLEQDISKYEF